MKLLFSLVFFTYVVLSGGASLLEMSRTLWARLLDGGIEKVGRLDPLRVPVIKVDQAEGNTTYRIILKDIEIKGLNQSILESVQVARGKLKSNFSDVEAGYVSYTDLRDLDTIRYRFHTLRKDEKNDEKSQESRFSDQRFQGNEGSRSRSEENRQDSEERGRFGSSGRGSFSNDGKSYTVDVKASSRDAAPGVQLIYAQKVTASEREESRSKDEVDCFGSCAKFDDSKEKNRQQQREFSQQQRTSQQQFAQQREYDPPQKTSQPQFSEQREYDPPQKTSQQQFAQQKDSDQSRRTSQQQRTQQREQGQPRIFEQQQQFSQQRQYNQEQRYPQQQQYKQQEQYNDQQGKAYTANYRDSARSSANDDEYKQPSGYRNQDTPQSGYRSQDRQQSGFRSQERERQNYRTDDSKGELKDDSGTATICPPGTVRANLRSSGSLGVNVQSQRDPPSAANDKKRPSSAYTERQFENQYSAEGSRRYSNGAPASQREYDANSGSASGRLRDRQGSMTVKFIDNPEQARTSESSSSSRLKQQQQPGYLDVIYVDGKSPEGTKHFGNLQIESGKEVKVYGMQDLMKDLRESGRYIVHNFTEGEALTKRNDLARIADETKRIKDLIRYARNHQESEGYFEEGMELIFHYGDEKRDSPSDEVPRKKRANDADNKEVEKEEDDVMHVILRIRVPVLEVRANYALNGKVADEFVRGNGLLTGTFTDLTGDFTVELKKAGEDRMVVRATRAKLVAKDKKVSLEGMNRKGPVEVILSNGLMAVEAVAAMIADDLATKALNEKIADAAVYKMYKNLSDENV